MKVAVPTRTAFTLIEVLVVVAIIAVLVAVLLPSLSKAREQTRRDVCLSNTRQINMACVMNAQSERTGLYVAARDTGDDSLNHIWPKYLPQPRVAICPSTENVVRDNIRHYESNYFKRNIIDDLDHNARNALDGSGGHSYEVWGWYDGRVIYPDGKTIDGRASGTFGQQVGWTDTKRSGYSTITDDVIKKERTVKFPNWTLLALDSDQGYGNDDINNWPDKNNNHGFAGLNVGFLDGHSEWVRPNQVVKTYLRSYNDPPSNWREHSPANLKHKVQSGFEVWVYE